jgi:hypothetical protein
MIRLRRGHLILLTAAAFVLADATIIWIGVQADFAFDFTCCYQKAAVRALEDPASLYAWSDDYTFRYTPLGALFFAPLAPLSETAAVWTWLGFKGVVLGATAWWFARPWAGIDRWLVVALVVAFPPIVHDLVLGNVSTIVVFATLALARWPDARGGAIYGLLVVLMPKPYLIPVLVYLAVRRTTAFLAATATILAGIVVGVLIFGTEPWTAFLGTLTEPLGRTFTANVGFSGLLGPAGVAIGIAVGLVVLVVGTLDGGARGFGLGIIGGILMGPYTFIHYLATTIVAVEPVLRIRPRRLAIYPWLLVIFPLIPIWLTLLAVTVRSTPPAPRAEAERPAAAPG